MNRKILSLLLKELAVISLVLAAHRYLRGPLSQCIAVWAFAYISWTIVANQQKFALGPKVPKWVAYLCGFPKARRVDTKTLALQLAVLAASLLASVALLFFPNNVLSFALLAGGGTATLVAIWGSTHTIDNHTLS